MFEGRKLPGEGRGAGWPGSGPASDTGEELRALSWPELVSRLGAAADLRRMLASANRDKRGSFSAGARRVLGEADHCIRPVNPNDLGNGKSGNGMETGVGQSQTGDRGRE